MTQYQPMPRLAGNRMPPRRRRVFYLIFLVLAASGLVWLVDHAMRADDAIPGQIAPWSMKVHGAAAMFSLVGFGMLWDGHVRRGWAQRKSRWSGAAMGSLLVLLAVSGFGLYYFDGETLRRATEWLHWVAGGAAICALLWHLLAARRIRTRRTLHPTHGTAHHS